MNEEILIIKYGLNLLFSCCLWKSSDTLVYFQHFCSFGNLREWLTDIQILNTSQQSKKKIATTISEFCIQLSKYSFQNQLEVTSPFLTFFVILCSLIPFGEENPFICGEYFVLLEDNLTFSFF